MAKHSFSIVEDPNSININPGMTNAVAQYQDMHIFAELTAKKRGRTTVIKGESQTNQNELSINFLGVNQNTDSPNYLNFTTDYYDGSMSPDETQHDGFGISSIKIIVNSSYIPQITIQFVDVRGLMFFNSDKSPYRILFDFPPPIFTLKVKGYYGQTLSYELHLVKYTTEFKAENGNFIIDAQFVAVTFAPLSDILFRYIVNAPLINIDNLIINPNPYVAPVNTFDLINKLKYLYADVKDKIKNSDENKELDKIIDDIENLSDSIDLLKFYKDKFGENALLFTYDKTDTTENNNINKLTNINQYDEIIKGLADPSKSYENILQQLYVGFEIQQTNDGNYNSSSFNILLKQLLAPVSGIDEFNLQSTFITDNNQKYIVINFTEFYVKNYRKRISAEKKKNELSDIITTKVNNAINSNLGMTPTIYNIFKIIMNDVDKFFQILNNTSSAADGHHEKYKDKISKSFGTYADNKDKIYPFPLIIEKEKGCSNRQHRIAPIETSQAIPEEFPEIKLVNDFIDTFAKQSKIQNQLDKNAVDDTGVNLWVPFSPVDSQLFSSDLSSPYQGITNVSDAYYILLNRYYVLTQNVFITKLDSLITNEYRDLYSKAEALNLVNSIANNDKLLKIFLQNSSLYKTDTGINTFFATLSLNKENFKTANYNFNKNTIKAIPITQRDILNVQSNWNKYGDSTNIDEVSYNDKNNVNYKGLAFTSKEIKLRDNNYDESDIFKGLTDSSFTQTISAVVGYSDVYFKLINQNLAYFHDTESDEDSDFDSLSLKTKFLYYQPNMFESIIESSYKAFRDIFSGVSKKIIQYGLVEWLEDGNVLIADKKTSGLATYESAIKAKVNINTLWIILLSDNITVAYNTKTTIKDYFDNHLYKYYIKERLIESNSISNDTITNVIAMLLLSNIGFTIGPYNKYPYDYNGRLFYLASVVEMPTFLPLYLGGLIYIKENENLGIIEELEYFFNTIGKDIGLGGRLIFADYYDINEYMSNTDKKILKDVFIDYMTDDYGGFGTVFYIEGTIGNNREAKGYLIDLLTKRVNDTSKTWDDDKVEEYYKTNLNPVDKSSYYFKILKELIVRKNMGVFYETTFSMDKDVNFYTSISTINNELIKSVTRIHQQKFFKSFFNELYTKIKEIAKTAKEKADAQRKIIGDTDVITQLYYSFKNIHDKWLTGNLKPNNNQNTSGGYPFNDYGKLINQFAFVDRTMNPIGDTIINAELLVDMFNNPDVTLFSVVSQLLSVNNFEFFPLQNFMSHEYDGWGKMFSISQNIDVTQSSAFVCMYIGGTSSYPSNLDGTETGFQNDGILDLSIPAESASDITKGCGNENSTTNDVQEKYNKEFPWRQVRAFRVKFGEQNQSMFNDIKIESKEYPETNESIAILSRLAGDGGENPTVPKGQNLYNLYENRAYRATITGLGNAMIQPTQYFQLDNVPMFNGAYIILDVEHSITPNKMTTKFSGVKILKYPLPRVTNPSAALGFTSPSSAYSVGEFTALVGAENNPPNAKYNSMYETYIQ